MIERFNFYTPSQEPGKCWPWQGSRTTGYGPDYDGGYGVICGSEKTMAARWAYTYFRGEIPNGLEPDHVSCNNPPCVNPWHLELVTHRKNCQRRSYRTPYRFSRIERDEIRNLVRSGIPATVVAKELGAGTNTIRRILRRQD